MSNYKEAETCERECKLMIMTLRRDEETQAMSEIVKEEIMLARILQRNT